MPEHGVWRKWGVVRSSEAAASLRSTPASRTDQQLWRALQATIAGPGDGWITHPTDRNQPCNSAHPGLTLYEQERKHQAITIRYTKLHAWYPDDCTPIEIRSPQCPAAQPGRKGRAGQEAPLPRRPPLPSQPAPPGSRLCASPGPSAAPRRLNRGDVDLAHVHHRGKRALGLIAEIGRAHV